MHPPFKGKESKGATTVAPFDSATSTLAYLEVETNKVAQPWATLSLKDKSEVYIRYISTGYHE